MTSMQGPGQGQWKRRAATALGVVVVLAVALWLAALSYSRHDVRARMAETVAQLDALRDISAGNVIERDGFFSADGQLRLTRREMADADISPQGSPALVLDWQLRYGVLHTALSGAADVIEAGGRALFADELSPGERVAFEAHLSHLDRSARLTVDAPATVTWQRGDTVLTLENAAVVFARGEQGSRLAVDFSALDYHSPVRQLRLGALQWSTRFDDSDDAVNDGPDKVGREDRLDAEDLHITRSGGLPLSAERLHFEGRTLHGSQQLRYPFRVELDRVAVSQQQVGSATLEAELARIDEQAAREFVALVSRELASRWQSGALLEEGLVSLVRPWQEEAFALLSDSPQLRVDALTVDSAMLEQPARLEGRLTLEGSDSQRLSLEQLQTSWGRSAFRRRLSGDLVLHNAPPLLALVMGQSPDQETLELRVREGALLINGEPWLLLDQGF